MGCLGKTVEAEYRHGDGWAGEKVSRGHEAFPGKSSTAQLGANSGVKAPGSDGLLDLNWVHTPVQRWSAGACPPSSQKDSRGSAFLWANVCVGCRDHCSDTQRIGKGPCAPILTQCISPLLANIDCGHYHARLPKERPRSLPTAVTV